MTSLSLCHSLPIVVIDYLFPQTRLLVSSSVSELSDLLTNVFDCNGQFWTTFLLFID